MVKQGASQPLSTMDGHVQRIDPRVLRRSREEFRARGYTKAPYLVPAEVKQAVAGQVIPAVERRSTRRDLIFKETGNTPRRMSNLDHDDILANVPIVPELYRSAELRRALGEICGETVFVCPYEPERFVITCLERSGDTHGWHWDDFSFALVWVLECPPMEQGGFVQCVPNTHWDKEHPEIFHAMASSVTYTVELRPGDLYVMRTDTTLHRVYPIQAGRRVIINMGYAAARDFAKNISHETMDTLWAATPQPARS